VVQKNLYKPYPNVPANPYIPGIQANNQGIGQGWGQQNSSGAIPNINLQFPVHHEFQGIQRNQMPNYQMPNMGMGQGMGMRSPYAGMFPGRGMGMQGGMGQGGWYGDFMRQPNPGYGVPLY